MCASLSVSLFCSLSRSASACPPQLEDKRSDNHKPRAALRQLSGTTYTHCLTHIKQHSHYLCSRHLALLPARYCMLCALILLPIASESFYLVVACQILAPFLSTWLPFPVPSWLDQPSKINAQQIYKRAVT